MRKSLMLIALAVGLFAMPAFASKKPLTDGSDPMPLCHPTPQKPCSKLYVPVVPFTEAAPKQVADGGPLPQCRNCPISQCRGNGKCAGNLKDETLQDRLFVPWQQ